MIQNVRCADQANSGITDATRTERGFTPAGMEYMQVSAIREEGNGLPVKSPACAYVGSNPTPATHNPRSGPVCGPGLMRVRERFRGPFTVSAGQLRARSGQVSGLCPARPALGGGRGLRIGDRSLRRGVPAGHGPAAGACRVPLSPAASHCGQLCADAWRTESGRVITGFRGPAAGHMACPVTGIEPGHWRSRKVSTARRQGCALSAYRRLRALKPGSALQANVTQIINYAHAQSRHP